MRRGGGRTTMATVTKAAAVVMEARIEEVVVAMEIAMADEAAVADRVHMVMFAIIRTIKERVGGGR